MLLCLYTRSSQAKLLKSEQADEVFKIAEKKKNSITDILFLKYYFDFGLLQLYSWEIFSENFFRKFFQTLCAVVLEERSVRLDSECLGNENSIYQKII